MFDRVNVSLNMKRME